MLAVTFDEANFTYHKPASMTDEQCSSLHVWKGEDVEGTPVIISCWRFSKEDLEEIQRTGVIYLSIIGNGMPPVALFTEQPFRNQESETL